MKVIELRSLMDDAKELREVRVTPDLKLCFQTWYELFVKKVGREPTLMDVFNAGYVLSNPIVKEQFLRNKKKDIEIENRINYSRR